MIQSSPTSFIEPICFYTGTRSLSLCQEAITLVACLTHTARLCLPDRRRLFSHMDVLRKKRQETTHERMCADGC